MSAFLLGLYEKMVLIREFEEGQFLFLEGSMPARSTSARAGGHGRWVCAALAKDDFITSTFRGHGHAAKGLSVEGCSSSSSASTGCCRGKGAQCTSGTWTRGWSRHRDRRRAFPGGRHGAGVQDAEELSGRRLLFGDAAGGGAFHEGVNLAAIWDLLSSSSARITSTEPPPAWTRSCALRASPTGRPPTGSKG